MKKAFKIVISVLILVLGGFLYYYIALPAINIHSPGFWWFILAALLLMTVTSALLTYADKKGGHQGKKKLYQLMTTVLGIAAGILVAVFIIGSILSSPIVNAKKYQKLLTINDRNFQDDIKEISYKEIPILDKDSAILLGSRKMGSIAEYVSQFEVSSNYTQINYQGTPVRVTPLEYGSVIKWFTNRSKGIPAYIKIDMATQNVELVKLPKGIKYSEAEHFGRNIYRYLRFHYPTYVFDKINFEIDDQGTPYWICPVKDYTIGLFGGQTIGRAVLVNAETGELTDYALEEVPVWVDKVFSAELLISL